MRYAAFSVAFCALLSASCGESTRSEQTSGPGDATGAGVAGAPATGGAGIAGSSALGGAHSGSSGGPAMTGGSAGSVAGTGNDPGGSGGGEPDVSGAWALFAFEDPVAVVLTQNGSELTGYGCCAGLGPQSIIDCCGEIVGGAIVDRRATFGFAFEFGESFWYAADVVVSADVERMAGGFSRVDWPTAWVRIDESRGFLTSDDTALRDVFDARVGAYELTLSDASGGAEFSPDRTYELGIAGGLPTLFGDLGSFWAGEFVWNETEQALTVGPVPTTTPELPIGLVLRFEATVLRAVEATMPSGADYFFDAAPRLP
jgi:hypothetical protein